MADLSSPALRAAVYLDWRSIIAGAVVAAGVSFTLLAFGSAIGLSVASTAPTWRDSSAWLWFISGLYLVFIALCSYGVGGYVAGRTQGAAQWASSESTHRDSMHGLVTWGLATLLSGMIALGGAAATTRLAAPTGGSASASTSIAGGSILASELDQLFRSNRSAPAANIQYDRAEAARILLKSASHRGLSSADRDTLVSLVANTTGIGPDEATNRVTSVIALSQEEIHRARAAAVIEAFLVAAALIVGAAIAWFSAVEGGRDRESGTLPVWDWSFRGR